ncbi:MAG: flavodoxin family protein [Candidatus Bathyarchaeota archaeon]|nr:flavodoxin family protein [Candidatus Bathyarchaeota archaeon]
MKVCGLVGSSKKNGNVDLLVSQVLEGASREGAEKHKIHLNDLHIKPCQSCGVDPYPKYCLFDGDMKVIYDALESCDVVVLGSPVYFDTVSAQTKLVIDRVNCLMPYIKRPDGSFDFERRIKKRKKGVFIAVTGVDQEFNTILTTVKGFFNWANIELAETILYTHDDNEVGGVKDNKERMNYAFGVGIRIAKNFLHTQTI